MDLANTVMELQEQLRYISEDMKWTRETMRGIGQILEDEMANADVPANSDLTSKEIRDLILAEVELDKPFYPSDLAEEYGLDLDSTLEAIDMLRKEGRIIDRD